MATIRQMVANRANALRSTGPRTEDGKARSSLNATRHGLTGQVLVLTEEDGDAYRAHREAFFTDYRPQSPVERQWVQQMADIRWRLARIVAVENNLFSLTGHQSEFDTGNEQIDRALGQADALATQVQSLATLSIYEQRLTRQYEKAQEQWKEARWRRICREGEMEREAEAQAAAEAEAVGNAAQDQGPTVAAAPAQPVQPEAVSPEIGFVSSSAPDPSEIPPKTPGPVRIWTRPGKASSGKRQ